MKKVALVGTAPSGRGAPFDDPSWEVWGVGKRGAHVTRATRWFELHRLDAEPTDWATNWRAEMKTWPQETPIWMFYPEPDLGPHIVDMDPKPLIAKYGTFFMTSSFSWMMAQAIEEGFEEIGLWGVDMEYGTEYRKQRVGLRHFIDVAKLLKIDVRRVTSSGIALEPVPYPFWIDDPILSKIAIRVKAHNDTKANAASVAAAMQERVTRNEGARAELAGILKAPPTDVVDYATKKIARLEIESSSIGKAMQHARDDVKLVEGSLAELDWLEDYLSP